MGFDKSAVDQICIAGLIHDIGKIGIDEKILNKPGSLSVDEIKDIERHPEIGWRLLSSTNEFSELARFVLSHHEKWDGSGYLFALKGEAIPLSARMMALADVYDALRSKRLYKPAFSHEKAVEIILEGRGKHFDPDLVDLFAASHHEFEELFDRMN